MCLGTLTPVPSVSRAIACRFVPARSFAYSFIVMSSVRCPSSSCTLFGSAPDFNPLCERPPEAMNVDVVDLAAFGSQATGFDARGRAAVHEGLPDLRTAGVRRVLRGDENVIADQPLPDHRRDLGTIRCAGLPGVSVGRLTLEDRVRVTVNGHTPLAVRLRDFSPNDDLPNLPIDFGEPNRLAPSSGFRSSDRGTRAIATVRETS